MLELLQTLWSFVLGLLVLVWDLVVLVATLVGNSLLHLHVDAPRLEGLLVGVLLSWLLLRRDRHPLLRVLSAPLKLVMDVLDLAWDQVVEVVEAKVVGVWGSLMSALGAMKAKLSK